MMPDWDPFAPDILRHGLIRARPGGTQDDNVNEESLPVIDVIGSHVDAGRLPQRARLCASSVLWAAYNPSLGNDIAVLQVSAILVTALDDAGEGDAGYLTGGERFLILPANVLHGVGLKGGALVREHQGEVDAQDGLLHGE